MGRAQVILFVDESAREKSVFRMVSLGEKSDEEPKLSTVDG
jgi:hypothetical protein